MVIDKSDVFGEFSNLLDDFFLDEVNAHGHDGKTHQQVDAGQDQLGLTLLRFVVENRVARHEVSEPNRREGDEGEVGALQEAPAFPLREYGRAQHDVSEDEGLKPFSPYICYGDVPKSLTV